MVRLTKKQKKDLYGCVRFVHMTHEELVRMSIEPKYEVCRDYITEALSFKLNKYESAIQESLKLNNTNHRVNYKPPDEDLANLMP